MKNFNIMGVREKPIYRGELPKEGSLDSLQIYWGAWGKRVGDVFEGGVDTPMHTMKKLGTRVQTSLVFYERFLVFFKTFLELYKIFLEF